MPGNTWYKLGDRVNDVTGDLYYRGQHIREAYYRGETIWGEEFLGIRLVRLPDKQHYTENESLNYTGVKILGVWTHGHTEDITDKCEFFQPEGTFIDKSTALLGIIIARLPNKTTYGTGEVFDYSGVIVLAVYADGHTVDVTAECTFTPTSGKPVSNVHMVGIFVTKLPTGTEDNPYEGIEVTAVYSNGQTADVTRDCTFYMVE